MIEEKITRYKNDITIAERILKCNYSDQEYYEDLIARFKKILRFYEDLKKYQLKNQHNSFSFANNNFSFVSI